MPVNLNPEEKKVGKENFEDAVNVELRRDEKGNPVTTKVDGKDVYVYDRRDFLKGATFAGIATGVGLGAAYFGYGDAAGMKPVKTAFLGTGDEGNVLIGAINPKYIDVVAIADIRPLNKHRAFHGDYSSDNALKVRPGLIKKYKDIKDAEKEIKVYDDYKDVLKDAKKLGLEAVVIALPLHLHAEAAILAMKTGLHVLTEKLMGHSVLECKEMGRVSEEEKKILATGHQRHYSILYANAVHAIKNGFIGDVHHIRAQWHREKDTWSPQLPNTEDGMNKLKKDLENANKKLNELGKSPGNEKDRLMLTNRAKQLEMQIADAEVDAAKYGYITGKIEDPVTKETYEYTPMEELIRWRLWERTGGGLMAELGSHQLDASTIFCTAARNNGVKAHPLSVTAVGGRHLYDFKRQAEDHVYCMFEFPGPKYDESNPKTLNNKIVVTYSSINGNGFGGYGEVVMGDKGTLVLLTEAETMLYGNEGTAAKININKDAVDTTASGGAKVAIKATTDGPVSRGYTEELEHWAWCIRQHDPNNFPPTDEAKKPRCHPEAAMADAIIALTTNIAMRNPERPRIKFNEKWFKIDEEETPEAEFLPEYKGKKPDTNQEKYKITWDKV